MQKLALVVFSLFLGLGLAPLALAQERTSSNPVTAPTSQSTSLAQTARVTFKQRLALIKDARKQSIVQRIDTRIQEINTNRTEQMNTSLSRLSTILDRVVAKTATLTPAISATSTTALADARTKITSSQAAVATQQAKQYVIQITTDASLAQAVASTITSLETDLVATHQTVLDAKQAVLTAIGSVQAPSSTINP